MTSDRSPSRIASPAPTGDLAPDIAPAIAPADSPIRPTDDEARDLARRLITEARFGALGVIDPASGMPHVTRIAVGHDGSAPLILVSMLALHTRASRGHRLFTAVGRTRPKG